jgi:hypothetical protein
VPTLRADSYADLVHVIVQNEADVKAGVYDFEIDPAWVGEMSIEAIDFFAARRTESGALARSPCTPPRVLSTLLRRERAHAFAIASNAAATAEILVELAKACPEDERVANAVAGHANSPGAAFQVLAGSPSLSVQTIVASSQRAPAECLAELAKSSATRVRAAVAENRTTPEQTLSILRRDTAHDVQTALERNPVLRKQEGRCAVCGTPIGAFRKLFGNDTCGKH